MGKLKKNKTARGTRTIDLAKFKGPRDIVRVMQGITIHCSSERMRCISGWLHSMRERHSRYEGMFTLQRNTEVAPLENESNFGENWCFKLCP